MAVMWIIAKFAVYTFVLVVLYRQSYNLIFMLAERPNTWILFAGGLGIGNMMLAYALSWDDRLVSAVVFTAFLLNIAPSLSKEQRAEVKEIYQEIGLPNGQLQSKVGLAVFAACSLLSYVVLFGKICNNRNECESILHILTS